MGWVHRCSYRSCRVSMFIDAVHQLSRCSSMPIKADRCLWHIYAKTDADVHCAGQIYSSSEMHSCAWYERKGVKLATTGMDERAKSSSVGQMAWYTMVGQMVWYTTVGEIAQSTTVSVVRLYSAGTPRWVESVSFGVFKFPELNIQSVFFRTTYTGFILSTCL